ncbi:hypothetical protein Ddye_000418 [Dipteronia dyeriana]|uniref:Uncharacterized protein n=1 Tax=Dipteronia dyeriana TaxID=168575 RepID=A0AAD9XLP4_9ROSI|nr:hypothetical protein Ddye_000418 [Dipteronia dyeriana]
MKNDVGLCPDKGPTKGEGLTPDGKENTIGVGLGDEDLRPPEVNGVVGNWEAELQLGSKRAKEEFESAIKRELFDCELPALG